MCNGAVRIDRIDPDELDLDTADAMSDLVALSQREAGVEVSAPTGPTRLNLYQHGSDGTPFAGLWLAREGDELLGYAQAFFPHRENTDSAQVGGTVAVGRRGRGVGRALFEAVVSAGADAGRTTLYAGAFEGSDGQAALAAFGFERVHTYGINRLDLHGGARGHRQRLHDDAAAAAADYELARLAGPTPADQVDDVVALFDAINDAPRTDPEAAPDRWTADRVRGYDRAMAARRQTVYRVLARHRGTGALAGHTVLCVDEFDPSVGHQEDTTVVREHRGHRLGVLLKTEMLRWMGEERPEMAATETWNSVVNHHMLAVNELLGTTQVARHVSMRRV